MPDVLDYNIIGEILMGGLARGVYICGMKWYYVTQSHNHIIFYNVTTYLF